MCHLAQVQVLTDSPHFTFRADGGGAAGLSQRCSSVKQFQKQEAFVKLNLKLWLMSLNSINEINLTFDVKSNI